MDIQELYKHFRKSAGVTTDTRKIAPNQIFFALKGEHFDANQFAAQALEKGAALAIVDNSEYHRPQQGSILVDDTLKCLQDLARYHRQQLRIPVIGLTGSNGKTTSKELMAAVLSKKFNTAYTQGNLNNHIGVPLSVLAITDQKHEVAVIEMGANHQGEIALLSGICQPDYGYITNFGKAHLEGFGGLEGVIKGKSELYDFLRTHGRKAFVNADDPKQLTQSTGIERISFGESPAADYPLRQIPPDDHGFVGIAFGQQKVHTQLTGQYNFSNLGIAVAIGLHFGVSPPDIASALKAYGPQNNRSQVQTTGRNQLVIDTYNANPSSTEAALVNFNAFPGQNKWVILGDMYELGPHEAEEHQRLAQLAASYGFEKVLLVGPAYARCPLETSGASILQLPSTEALLEWLKEKSPEGKSIMLKGSRGMALERAVEHL